VHYCCFAFGRCCHLLLIAVETATRMRRHFEREKPSKKFSMWIDHGPAVSERVAFASQGWRRSSSWWRRRSETNPVVVDKKKRYLIRNSKYHSQSSSSFDFEDGNSGG
jgi:hypothetical protein